MCIALYTGGCEGWLCLPEVLEVLDVPEVIRCVPLGIQEAVVGGLCLLEVLEEP